MLLGIIINCEDMYKYYIHYLLMMKILNLMFLSVLYGVPYDGLTLITDIGQTGQGGGENEGYETQLIDNELNIINSWFYDTRPSSIAYLSPDSILFLPCKVNQNEGAGPNGGRFKKIDWYGNVIWDYEMPEEICKPHHDIAVLPNGNILVICSEEKTQQEALNAGIDNINGPMRLDMILEIEPIGFNDINIIWKWHFWDHLVQDINMSLDNYGQISEHPELLDINVSQSGNGGNGIADWNHCNAISYNPTLDQIVLSSRHMDEFYVIDHSTTIEEASNHSGGDYGQGGDFLYRWGNPQNYHRGNATNQILKSPHGINWIPSGYPGGGNFIIFNNEHSNNSSAVLEIISPINSDGTYEIDTINPFGPNSYHWIHQSNFYSDKQSGAFRLPNGNTIITSTMDDFIVEVNEFNNIEWTYTGALRSARAIKYSQDYFNNESDCNLTTDDILGPYYFEDAPFRNVIAHEDEPGQRLFISGAVKQNDCEQSISGALIEIWQANDEGCYGIIEDCDTGNPENDYFNLRGKIFSDVNGYYYFESILPGYYGTRPRHVHIKITTPNGEVLITQLYFENDPFCETDPFCQSADDRIISLQEIELALYGEMEFIMNSNESGIIIGDLNYDNSVDILDVIILVNHILSPAAVVLDGADINGDGEVNILDVVALVNIILSS